MSIVASNATWKLVSNTSVARPVLPCSGEVKKIVARNRMILAGTIALAAVLAGMTVPAFAPAIAATNSH